MQMSSMALGKDVCIDYFSKIPKFLLYELNFASNSSKITTLYHLTIPNKFQSIL